MTASIGRDGPSLLQNVRRWAWAIVDALKTPTGARFVTQLLNYVYEVTDEVQYDKFRETIHASIPEAERETMTMAEQLRQEGRQQGRQEGEQKGRQSLLERQLTLKFGELDDAHYQRLSEANEEQLLTYAMRVLTADSIESVFAAL